MYTSSFSELMRKAAEMSITEHLQPSWAMEAKFARHADRTVTGENVATKSTFLRCKNPRATKRLFNCSTRPLLSVLVRNAQVPVIARLFLGSSHQAYTLCDLILLSSRATLAYH